MLRPGRRLRPVIAAAAAVLIVVRGDAGGAVPDVADVPDVAEVGSLGVPAPRDGPGTLVTISPIRALDTRTGRPLGPGGATTVDVVPDGAVPAEVAGVVLSVGVVGATEPTFVVVGPDGAVPSGRIDASPGATVSAPLLVAVGDGGSIRVANADGETHVVIDVAGYVLGP